MAAGQHQATAEFLRTLGHSTRLQVLELLSERELSAAQLTAELRLESSTLSGQLALLRRCGLVSMRRAGTAAYYSLTDPQIAELLAMTRKILTGVLSDQLGLLEALRAESTGTEGKPE